MDYKVQVHRMKPAARDVIGVSIGSHLRAQHSIGVSNVQ